LTSESNIGHHIRITHLINNNNVPLGINPAISLLIT